MARLFINIFNMSISASYLILAVLLVRFVFRKAPKNMRCFLWLLVAVRLVLPFSIESVFSLIPDTQVTDAYVYEMTQPEINTQTSAPGTKAPSVQPVVNPSVSGKEQTTGNRWSTVRIASKLWMFGMLLMAGYMAVSWFRLRSRVRTAIPAESVAEDGNAIKYYRSDAVDAPFLFGLFRPRIYIPSHIAEEELPYVLLHERTHKKRKDYLIKPFGFLLLSVYWFNPCVWAAYIMLCKDIELICDEKVVQELGAQHKQAYSQALLDCAVNHRVISACPVAFGEVSVKARVKNILNYKKPAFWVLAAAVLACIIVPVCFMTQKKTEDTDMQRADNSENISTASDDAEKASAVEGTYELFSTSADQYFFIPKLTLEKGGRFSFGYDLASSYLPYGTYELKDNILTAVTDDGEFHYQFTCISGSDDSVLVFDAEHSSNVSGTDVRMNAPIFDGSVFMKSNISTVFQEVDAIAQEFDSEDTVTADEYQDMQIELEELKKQLRAEELLLQRQLEDLKEQQRTQEEIETLTKAMLALTMQTEICEAQLEEIQAEYQAAAQAAGASAAVSAYDTIEQWARAFCDRDGGTIVRLADENAEQKLADKDMLTHDFDGEKDSVAFGWSSPWPWGADYDEDELAAYNYRIVNVTERSAEILYYAWVSDPHVTVWRELLTYKMENDKCVITSETLQFRDSICTAEEFYQAYPDGITGTMMDYYSFNGAGEALNDNAKNNRESQWYSKLFAPDTAAVYLLNILDNPNKVGAAVTKSNADESRCTVTFDFYEDGSSVDVLMMQPYGADGIWVPYSETYPESSNTLTGTFSIITGQNVDSMIEEDAKTLAAVFPNHHDDVENAGFPKTVDLNGDGAAEKIELTNLGYNGGEGGYALKVTDTKTGKQIPLPDGYTEEGFPFNIRYSASGEEGQMELQLGLSDEKNNVPFATITSGALLRIYERRGLDDEIKDELLRKNSFGAARIDTVTGCNIVTFHDEETPTLVLKSYVSGGLGHMDHLGYVITELRLRKDNTWDSKHYFLLHGCEDRLLLSQSRTQQTEEVEVGEGGASVMPFKKGTDVDFLQLLPEE